ncbi:hypothetical protein [Sorangium sp. So ce128]|uniref:hypothetical protein n=1 Tax=Sorangium sp. So ce128 TaxID=3133281 RepID=UPI003F5F327F
MSLLTKRALAEKNRGRSERRLPGDVHVHGRVVDDHDHDHDHDHDYDYELRTTNYDHDHDYDYDHDYDQVGGRWGAP